MIMANDYYAGIILGISLGPIGCKKKCLKYVAS